jgi:hypothetical protein
MSAFLGPRLLVIAAIGRAGQPLAWLGANVDAWIWHGAWPQWRDACAEHGFKPYGDGTWFDLDANPDAAVEHGPRASGRSPIVDRFLATAAGSWRVAHHVESEADEPSHEGNLRRAGHTCASAFSGPRRTADLPPDGQVRFAAWRNTP